MVGWGEGCYAAPLSGGAGGGREEAWGKAVRMGWMLAVRPEPRQVAFFWWLFIFLFTQLDKK